MLLIAVYCGRRGRNLRAKLDTVINSLSASHAYLKMLYTAVPSSNSVHVRVQEAEGVPSAAELQEKLKLTSSDEPAKPTLNGRRTTPPGKGLDRTVFEDF